MESENKKKSKGRAESSIILYAENILIVNGESNMKPEKNLKISNIEYMDEPTAQVKTVKAFPAVERRKENSFRWKDFTSPSNNVPEDALKGGKDLDGCDIYVGKAYFKDDWLPAKIVPGRKEAFVSWGGYEYKIKGFQVLCGGNFTWTHSHQDIIPPNSMEGGLTKDGETLYIGRVDYRSAKIVGKVHPSYKCCFIPFGGKEIGFGDYEILIHTT